MLNRAKIIEELSTKAIQFSNALLSERERALRLWQLAVNQQDLAALVSMQSLFPVPTWVDAVGSYYAINACSFYHAVAFDGSQIYPDRHQGIDCFLINIGQAHFYYGLDRSDVFFDSKPFITLGSDENDNTVTPEMVNAYRTELELQSGLEYAKSLKKSKEPLLFMMDGSLIFWHLPSLEGDGSLDFFPRYIALLEQFFEHDIFMVGYISLSKSKELINVLKCVAEHHGQDASFKQIVDSDIMQAVLKPGERSTIFSSRSALISRYPSHSQPHFFYMNTGHEIARIEIPAWIAMQNNKLNLVCSMIYDQAIKGYGYPIALAEAHEQAVVEGQDREFFFYLLQNLMGKNGQSLSSKLQKKRRASI